MAIVFSVLNKLFGKKSDKDRKLVWPLVEEINEKFQEFDTLSDEGIKSRYTEIKSNLHELTSKIESENDGKEPAEIDEILYDFEKKFLDEHMLEVFALVKEATKRLMGSGFTVMGNSMEWDMIHYDVQLMGGIVLHQGKITEMKTGEGKTLVSTLPIILNSLSDRGIHIVTVNDYLAERDSQWMGHLFKFFDLSVGCILDSMDNMSRKEQYSKDVTYGTNSQFGFDYLRDNMRTDAEGQVQRKHIFAIIDEVDSVLIDEARMPLIISGPVDSPSNHKFNDWRSKVESLFKKQNTLITAMISDAEELLDSGEEVTAGDKLLACSRGAPRHNRFMKVIQKSGVQQLIQRIESDHIREKNLFELDETLFFSIDEKNGIIDLTEMGRQHLSPHNPEHFIIPDLGELFHDIDNDSALSSSDRMKKKEEAQSLHAERSDRIHTINALLRAFSLYEKDVHYIVQSGKVMIVDEHTGRVLPTRRYSDGLHMAIEAKERVVIEKEQQTVASITIQNYFRMYRKLCGMTGTAVTEAAEFMEIYGMDVVEIDSNRPIVRKDHDDVIYKTNKEKYIACIDKIEELFNKGQPVLVGTTSVEESEKLDHMLKRRKVPHNVLNAKRHQSEALVVQRAGQLSAVTISTNMAGRGTDIKLADGVKGKGGLFILGTGRHDSRRIDLQLKGRSGRQGDPGETIFYLSLEDRLMRLFGSDRIAKIMDKMGLEEGEVITHPMVSKSIARAQKKVESNFFSMRKHVLQYDEVMNTQRGVIYTRRNFTLHSEDVNVQVTELIEEQLDEMIEHYSKGKESPNAWDWEGLGEDILDTFMFDISPSKEKISSISDFKSIIMEGVKNILNYKRESIDGGIFDRYQQMVVLTTIDNKWRQHLYSMDQLREGINLRSYGQKNPLNEYKKEGYEMFMDMMYDINTETLKRIFRTNLVRAGEQATSSKISMPKNLNMKHDSNIDLGFVAPPKSEGQRETTATRTTQPKAQPVTSQKKIGRNEPCPCGSGKKYKKCHGALS